MKQWLENDRQNFLKEFLRMEGYGLEVQTACGICGERRHEYQCTDCFNGQRLCLECMRGSHTSHPLHKIEKWNGMFMERISLKKLGVRIQLNHIPSERCFNPKRAFNDDFVIIDSHGMHEVALDFCECERAPSHSIQLLRARLYPATGTYPKTAATFKVLRQFHLLSFESKCSGYEFYNSIVRLTDNTGSLSRVRYVEFMRMVRQWRHLKMLKRTARGHDPRGIEATKPGQCALLCPACPQPGINLPPGWESAPSDRMWLYTLFIAIDANFRLQRKRVSSDERDPGLGNGWAFFVDETPYKDYLVQNWDHKQDRSTCMSHDAVDKPDREARGLAASGAGTIDCARHDFKRPNGVGDLQLGERYINMDYLFFSSLQGSKLKTLVVSYDIACQWHKNIFTRMKSFPSEMQLSESVKYIAFLVPKFHLPAHIEDCMLQFSFNLTKGVGRTDGEAPERGWASINPVAQSTKEMGPGSRRDTLDDHFNDWNWKKIIAFGERMLSKIQEAVPARSEHRQLLKEFEASVPPSIIKEWTTAVNNWENDASQPSPFKSKTKSISEREARLQLAAEAAKEVMSGPNYDHMSHPSVMIANGLQLEDDQRRLATDIADLGQHPTTKQLTEILERSNLLRRKIGIWTDEQILHMPQAAPERMKHSRKASPDGVTPTKVTNMPLFLPSALSKIANVDKALCAFEWKLREGQAYDALEEMRHVLRLRTHMYKHKDRFSQGVKANTRSNVAIVQATARINRSAEKYRAARAALASLAPGLELEHPMWEYALRKLEQDDIRGLSEGLYGDSEGRRKPSWIWMTYGVIPDDGDDPALNEALRIEWCRARARAKRWDEEVQLLQEEMQRILAFLDWQAEWWERQGVSAFSLDAATMRGMTAYAHRQASLRRELRDRFSMTWRNIPTFLQWDDSVSTPT
ncbi:hypothetical protein BDZ94DRAFT_1172825 [Collybia nuda]|uniref:CxC2-like cysteine cluster KDZ transposase-associated domain-containing protein n=1 Tax=Collybia nuda TaxID=64659 RepID=A0A9P5Y021_9AGAR|nr:hypothetical protein BDZ94DRAFT_1172825 [Collybia nuda]